MRSYSNAFGYCCSFSFLRIAPRLICCSTALRVEYSMTLLSALDVSTMPCVQFKAELGSEILNGIYHELHNQCYIVTDKVLYGIFLRDRTKSKVIHRSIFIEAKAVRPRIM